MAAYYNSQSFCKGNINDSTTQQQKFNQNILLNFYFFSFIINLLLYN